MTPALTSHLPKSGGMKASGTDTVTPPEKYPNVSSEPVPNS